jgi:uncharacterized protein (TIGR03118 family)
MKIKFVTTLALMALAAEMASAQNAFIQHNLTSDLPGMADNLDTNLVNPWGISFSSTSPFWMADNGVGLSTLYNGAGAPISLVVTIPPPTGGTPPAAPSGTVFNGTTNFQVAGVAGKFLFDTEDGTISGWASGSDAILEVDNSASNSVFKGLAIISNNIYATDFHNNQILIVNGHWEITKAFTDPTLPAGYAPFGIQNFGDKLYVTFALQDSEGHDDVGGPGNGYVDVFDSEGNMLQRLISRGALNSPWGLAFAPPGFGSFGGDLLVGNFGDGTINVFNPTNGTWLASLNDTSGHAISEPGLWALAFGNGGGGGKTNVLYFTAGIAGPDAVEDHGLFASVTPAFPGLVSGISYHQHNLTSDLPGVADNLDTSLVNPWGISFSPTSPFWIADNGSGLSSLYNAAGAAISLVVTIPPPTGATPPAAPSGTVFNSTGDFPVAGTPGKFLFDTEDGTISGWVSGADAVLKVDNSSSNSVFKGLAVGSADGSNYLYATDFHNNQVLMVDGGWKIVKSFTDTNLPPGFAPFGIQNLNGNLYVTFALQDGEAHDDVAGPGNGYVDVFDTKGNLIQSLIAGGALNSPWGVALAPSGFGAFGGALLIGNFGDGFINAYNPSSGAWLGALFKDDGNPFSEPGLWAIDFGNGGSGGKTGALYFTAGIAGPGAVEDHGLFGSLLPSIVSFGAATATNGTVLLTWNGGTGPFLAQTASTLTSPVWSTITTTTNLSLTVTNGGTNAFFRIIDTGQTVH